MAPGFFSKLLPFRNNAKNNPREVPAAVPRPADAGDATARLRKADRRVSPPLLRAIVNLTLFSLAQKSLSHLLANGFRSSSYDKGSSAKRATVFIPNVLYAFPQSPPLVPTATANISSGSPVSFAPPPGHPTPPSISPSSSHPIEPITIDSPPRAKDHAGLASGIALPESPLASTDNLVHQERMSVPNNMSRMSSSGDPMLSSLLAGRRRSSMFRPGGSLQTSRRPSLASISSSIAIEVPASQREAKGGVLGIKVDERTARLGARRGSEPSRTEWKPSEEVKSEWRHSMATEGPTGLGFGRIAKTGPPPPPKNPQRSGLKILYLDDGRSASDLPRYRHSIAAAPAGAPAGTNESRAGFSTPGKISALSGHASSLRKSSSDSTSIPPFSRSIRNSTTKPIATRLVRPTCSMATQTTPFFEPAQPNKLSKLSNLSATKSLPLVEINHQAHSLTSTFSTFDYPPSPPQSYSSFPRELLEGPSNDCKFPLPVETSCELSPSIYSIQHSPKNRRSGSVFDGPHRPAEIVESISSASTNQSQPTTVDSHTAPESEYDTPNETTTPSPDSPTLVPEKSEVGDFPTLFFRLHNGSVESSIHSIYNEGMNAPEKEEEQPIRRALVTGPNRIDRAERGRSHFLANAVQVARKERMRRSMVET